MQLLKEASKEKLRGGFYTPEPIASFVLSWALNGKKDADILEPSCGDGTFLEALKQSSKEYNSVVAVELDEMEARKAKSVSPENTKVINQDFYDYFHSTVDKFDLILGNPPYIRYQYLNSEQKLKAETIFRQADIQYSRLSNAWVSFVIASCLLLKEEGKIGFVLPAEILQVSHTARLREYLSSFFNKINIVSFRKLVFPGIQQEVVLLLCERNNTNEHLIEHLEVNDASDLTSIDVAQLKSPKKKIDRKTSKWTFYFLDQKEIDFIERLHESKIIPELGDFAEVEVGITTGSNPFFTVPLSIVRSYKLDRFAKPLVGRSVQVPSVFFTEEDWKLNQLNESRTHLLTFPAREDLSDQPEVIRYLKHGEEQGIHEGYKCRIRDEWQIVPSLRISDALFIRRNNQYPRLIVNKAKAYTTDTMHRVQIKKGVAAKAFVASYYNSLSLASAEICGRSHGGGVLELMPNEVEEIFLPYHKDNEPLIDEIDHMMRDKRSISDILDVTNRKILKEHYNFSKEEITLSNSIREKLANRRLNRH